MSYVAIDPAIKIAAVKRFWKTNNVQQTAKEFEISRSTLYEWVRLAETRLESVFEEARPGKRTATPEQENEVLHAQLHELLDVCHNISHESPALVPPPTALWCDRCERASFVRNGRVHTKRYGLRQRLLCRNCGRHVYVDVKKTL